MQGVGTPPPAQGGPPLRLAYADPPYPGLAGYYRHHPDYAGEVDHAELIARLTSTYDGWALSTSTEALRTLLPLCPPGTRVAAWHRGPRPTKAHGPLSAWEPVIYAGGRLWTANRAEYSHDTTSAVVQRDAFAVDQRHVTRPPATAAHLVDATGDGSEPDTTAIATRRIDSLICPRGGHRTTDPGRVIGTKPAAFARWIFDLLGAHPGDQLDDLYPGSGGIARAWQIYSGRDPA